MEWNERQIRSYLTPEGKTPFEDWLTHLKDRMGRVQIKRRIDRLRLGNFGDCKAIGDGVFELRVRFGPGYRVYFAEHKKTIVILLHGGHKNTQDQDIKRAKSYWKELKARSQ